MNTLIFDIETVGEEWESIDDITQKQLTKWIDRYAKDANEALRFEEGVKSRLGLSPFTGQIVCLGIYDLQRQQGVIYYLGDSEEREELGAFVLKSKTSEADILREFWEGARLYQKFVSFNGRVFDAPFLVHRSLKHHLAPTKNLLEGRYPAQQKTCRHIDLMDEFTFYGALRSRPSLHLLCRTYGISSPKNTVSAADVERLFREGNTRAIAVYNSGDLLAVRELYEYYRLLPQAGDGESSIEI